MTPFEKWKAGSLHKGTVNPVAVAMLKAAWDGCAAEAERVAEKIQGCEYATYHYQFRLGAQECAEAIRALKANPDSGNVGITPPEEMTSGGVCPVCHSSDHLRHEGPVP